MHFVYKSDIFYPNQFWYIEQMGNVLPSVQTHEIKFIKHCFFFFFLICIILVVLFVYNYFVTWPVFFLNNIRFDHLGYGEETIQC